MLTVFGVSGFLTGSQVNGPGHSTTRFRLGEPKRPHPL